MDLHIEIFKLHSLCYMLLVVYVAFEMEQAGCFIFPWIS